MRALPLLAIAALSACADTAAPILPGANAPAPNAVAAAGIPPVSDTVTYLCSTGQVVRAEYPNGDDRAIGPDGTIVSIDGRRVRMLLAASASGVRYVGGGWEWWTRGLQVARLTPVGPDGTPVATAATDCRSTG